MKKIILMICIMIITLSLLGGCGFLLNPGETSIKEDIYTEYEAMMDAFVEVESLDIVSDYILLWAQTLGIPAQKDRLQSVILETPGLENSEIDGFTTIECGISLSNLADDLRAVALTMVLLKEINKELPLRVLFIPYDNQNYYGANNISYSYLNNTKMIQLNTRDPNHIINQGASSKVAEIERPIKTKKPAYKLAYQITVDGFNENISTTSFAKNLNAIRELGALFATCKSKGVLFEIGGFSASASSNLAPVSGSTIMVVNQYDVKYLEYYYGKMESKLLNDYQIEHPDLLVSMSAIDLPKSVMSNEDTDNLVSFIYTVFNGFCGESEYSFSALNKADINKTKFSCNLMILNLINPNILEENDDLNLICNLNNMNYSVRDIDNGWYQDPESEFVNEFSEIANKKPKGTFLKSPLVEYQKRNKDLDILSYGVDLKDCEAQLRVLKKYIESKHLLAPLL